MSPANESDTVLSTVSYFLHVLPLHNPPLNKEQQILPCLLYSPYMLELYPLPTLNSTCSRFHCTSRYREGGPGPLGDLVSCRLMLPSANLGIFLFAQHYACLPDSSRVMTAGRLPGEDDNCCLPSFLLLYSYLCFYKQKNVQVCELCGKFYKRTNYNYTTTTIDSFTRLNYFKN